MGREGSIVDPKKKKGGGGRNPHAHACQFPSAMHMAVVVAGGLPVRAGAWWKTRKLASRREGGGGRGMGSGGCRWARIGA